jgi:hypothetical protein
MNEGAAGATISPPHFEICAIASAAVPTKNQCQAFVWLQTVKTS